MKHSTGMTTAERVYTGLTLAHTILFLPFLAMIHFLVIPDTDDPAVFYFVVSIFWAIIVIVWTTGAINLYYRKLLVIPTIVQCIAMFPGVFMIPLTIWGGALLYDRLKREREDQAIAPLQDGANQP